MEQLIQQVVQRTGISEEQARTAVQTVLGFVKERLPGPVAAQLDGVVSGAAGGVADKAGEVLGGLGGMFGGGGKE